MPVAGVRIRAASAASTVGGCTPGLGSSGTPAPFCRGRPGRTGASGSRVRGRREQLGTLPEVVNRFAFDLGLAVAATPMTRVVGLVDEDENSCRSLPRRTGLTPAPNRQAGGHWVRAQYRPYRPIGEACSPSRHGGSNDDPCNSDEEPTLNRPEAHKRNMRPVGWDPNVAQPLRLAGPGDVARRV